jgi:hypothetical protein
VPTEDDDNITIWNTEEYQMFESLCVREFVHTHVYNVNLLERVGLDIELLAILRSIGWGKLYDEPHSGSRLLTLEFFMTFDSLGIEILMFAFAYSGGGTSLPILNLASSWIFLVLACPSPKPW